LWDRAVIGLEGDLKIGLDKGGKDLI